VDTKAFIRAVLVVLCLVLLAPAVIWLVTTTSLEVVAVAGLGVLALIVLSALAFFLQWKFWPWFMGALAVLLTPGLLKLGAQFIVGDARGAMEAWIYIYVAGAVGGLLLELIRGRGGLEFPSADPPAAPRTVPAAAVTSPSPPVANGGEPVASLSGAIGPIGPIGPAPPSTGEPTLNSSVVTVPSPAVAPPAAFVATEAARENGTDLTTLQTPERGGRIDIGFFSRVTMGGLAAASVLIVVRLVVGDTQPAHFLASALRLDTLAGAVLVGMIAPALWSGTQTLVESRFSFMKGAIDTAVAAVANAEQAVRAARDAGLSPAGPEASQFIVDAGPLRSPEFIATIAREEDPTEVGKMLLTRINSSRIDLGAAQSQQEAQLGQALGSLETAERLLRSALQRASRR
jgi:hypothetical protein